MSKYTTGEMAKLTGVSVRTVQYYDDRGILVPSELSEGGRRLYSEKDLHLLRVICFLRKAGIPINSISALLKEEKPENIISVILEEQERTVREELSECESRLSIIEGIRREMREISNFSVESIGDIASIMKSKNERKKMLLTIFFAAIPVMALQWAAIILGITDGLWWLLGVWAPFAIVYGVWSSVYYYRHTAYICPKCHEVFRPKFSEVFFAYHTPRMRKLTCPKCGVKMLCLEIYQKDTEK